MTTVDPNITRDMTRTLMRLDDAIDALGEIQHYGSPVYYEGHILTSLENEDLSEMIKRLRKTRKELRQILATADNLESAGLDAIFPKRGE